MEKMGRGKYLKRKRRKIRGKERLKNDKKEVWKVGEKRFLKGRKTKQKT